ncbi:MAG: L,D-transpeptidase [Acidimicrobiales bacterium]|nr:L,D-transpeptidase [Acidimicrobiales bacterium]
MADDVEPKGAGNGDSATDAPPVERSDRPPRRLWPAIGALALAAVVMAAVVLISRSEDTPVAAPPATTTTTSTAAPTTTVVPTTSSTAFFRPPPAAWTTTAVPKGTVQGYSAPGGAPSMMVANTYYDIPTTLPVREERGEWIRVGTPYRPNSSSAWVRKSDVTLGMSPWHIEIDVTRAKLQLYKEGVLLLDTHVGIGTDYTPTAIGEFFVTHFQNPPNAAYGPFVMVTSGHSETLQSYDGFPDAIMAIHGPINSEWAFAGVGARISNGCVRMSVADQQQLAQVTPGSPVTVYASPAPPPEPEPDPSDPSSPGTTPTAGDPGAEVAAGR